MEFPRSVYKSPGKKKYGKGLTYDSIVVRDEEELKMCEDKGFINSFQDALYPKEEEIVISEKPDWRKLAIDAGLEGDELKKFMKKSSPNRQKFLDSLGV